MIRIRWKPRALADIRRLDPAVASRILEAIERLAKGERLDTKKLHGTNEYRLRVGDWRIRFTKQPEEGIGIERVLHRSAAYR